MENQMTDDELDTLHAAYRKALSAFKICEEQRIELLTALDDATSFVSAGSRLTRQGKRIAAQDIADMNILSPSLITEAMERWKSAKDAVRHAHTALPEDERVNAAPVPYVIRNQ